MHVYINAKTRDNKNQDYVEFLKRVIRNKTGLTLYTEHVKELSKQVALSYGLTLEEYDEIGKELLKGESNNE